MDLRFLQSQIVLVGSRILVDGIPDRYSPGRDAANSINRSVDQYTPGHDSANVPVAGDPDNAFSHLWVITRHKL
jgi:hypothetical protein